MTQEKDASPVWLITGCSSGLGRASAEHALGRGDRVAVTARKPDTVTDLVGRFGDRAVALALDVTDPSSVAAAVHECEQAFGRIDVPANNAGHGYLAAVEESYHATDADEPPLRLLLGSDALSGARARIDRLGKELDAGEAPTTSADLAAA